MPENITITFTPEEIEFLKECVNNYDSGHTAKLLWRRRMLALLRSYRSDV